MEFPYIHALSLQTKSLALLLLFTFNGSNLKHANKIDIFCSKYASINQQPAYSKLLLVSRFKEVNPQNIGSCIKISQHMFVSVGFDL